METAGSPSPGPPACPHCRTPLRNRQLVGLLFRSTACASCHSTLKLNSSPVITLLATLFGFACGVAFARYGFSLTLLALFIAAIGLEYALALWLLKSGLIPKKYIRLKYAKSRRFAEAGGS